LSTARPSVSGTSNRQPPNSIEFPAGYRFISPGGDVTLLGLGVRATLAEGKG